MSKQGISVLFGLILIIGVNFAITLGVVVLCNMIAEYIFCREFLTMWYCVIVSTVITLLKLI